MLEGAGFLAILSRPQMLQTRATVYVADDHPVFREGLTRGIRQRAELELVGESADGREALAEIKALGPDVALLDLRLPGLDGLGVLNALRRDGCATAVVLLTAHSAAEIVYRAIAMGAAAFLTKEADRDQICDAVAAAARGETRLPVDVQGELVRQIQAHAHDDRPRLTTREREVLGFIADGLSAPQIARELMLSTATVKSHLQTLYDKLDVSDRGAAVATAMRRGLLE